MTFTISPPCPILLQLVCMVNNCLEPNWNCNTESCKAWWLQSRHPSQLTMPELVNNARSKVEDTVGDGGVGIGASQWQGSLLPEQHICCQQVLHQHWQHRCLELPLLGTTCMVWGSLYGLNCKTTSTKSIKKHHQQKQNPTAFISYVQTFVTCCCYTCCLHYNAANESGFKWKTKLTEFTENRTISEE